MPQEIDDAATPAQATHEAELENLRIRVEFWGRATSKTQTERDEARAELERVKADPRLQVPLDGPGSHRMDFQELRLCQEKLSEARAELERLQVDLRSLERSFAHAIEGQVQAERARDDARAESQKLLDENRLLRSAAVSEPFYCQCCATYECDCLVTE